MASCLIALGSNLGDRQATLQRALQELGRLPQTTLLRVSSFCDYPPMGGPSGQANFLNAAALLVTELRAEMLFAKLRQIETRCGRMTGERWAARTLDLDLLLFDEQVVETSELVLPHPRMSFRRFVLQPAAEIAANMIVPTIGWSIQRLFDCVCSSNNRLALLSTSRDVRFAVSHMIISRYHGAVLDSQVDHELWPREQTTWIAFAGESQPIDKQPKLTVTLESGPGEWRQPARADFELVYARYGRDRAGNLGCDRVGLA